jgi:hypothetical protein
VLILRPIGKEIMRSIRVFASAVVVPVLLTACGGGGSSDSSFPAINTGTGDGFTGGGDTFFNDTDGLKFADSIGGSFNAIFDAIFAGFDQDTTAAAGTFNQRIKRAAQTETAQCDTSGSISVTSNVNDATGELTSLTMSFNNCSTDGNVANGSMTLSITGTQTNSSVTMSFNNFTTTDGTDTSSLQGTINVSVAESGSLMTSTISGSTFTMASAGETVTFSNYNMTSVINDATDAASLSGGATIATSSDGTLVMSIDPALQTDGSADYPTSGTLSWVHSDGSQLLIDADTGNVDTFNYTINDGGSVSSGVGNWADTDLGGLSL